MYRKLFIEWPGCLATYAGLAILAGLLFFRYEPPKPPLPTFVEVDAPMAAAQYAIKVGGTPYSVAYTGSMKPAFQGGEIVVAVHNYETIKVGDVLIYNASFSSMHIMHRAVQKDKDGWIMSGDNTSTSESWERVRKANYLGTVVAVFKRS